jgi:hypothetical protein
MLWTSKSFLTSPRPAIVCPQVFYLKLCKLELRSRVFFYTTYDLVLSIFYCQKLLNLEKILAKRSHLLVSSDDHNHSSDHNNDPSFIELEFSSNSNNNNEAYSSSINKLDFLYDPSSSAAYADPVTSLPRQHITTTNFGLDADEEKLDELDLNDYGEDTDIDMININDFHNANQIEEEEDEDQANNDLDHVTEKSDGKCEYSSFLVDYKRQVNNQYPYGSSDTSLAAHRRRKRQAGPPGGGGGGNPGKGPGRGGVSRPGGGVTRPGGAGVTAGGGGKGGGGKMTKNQNGSRIATGRMSTPASSTASNMMYDDVDERTDLENYDDYMVDFELSYDKSPYWNVTCINRTFDENFKNFQKGVNRNVSTMHVPTNVYKQDLMINMTAYWTEAVNEQFRKNYDSDNELFWQYFCSSQGLFRRYPGAYWTVPQNEDFFDCRLQSWYIMAAASPKDVLILLDTSGSMTGVRLGIAKKLIEAILDTLSDNDFFNVLKFSKRPDFLMSNASNETMYRDRFIQAGKTNKQVNAFSCFLPNPYPKTRPLPGSGL